MNIFYQTSGKEISNGTSFFKERGVYASVMLGVFDGVHIGHAQLAMAAIENCPENGKTAAWTFSDISSPKTADALMPGDERKAQALSLLGIENIIFCDFDCIKDLTPREFVSQVLIEALGCKVAVCGENFRFGKGREGDARMLRELMQEHGGDAVILPMVTVRGRAVSSTLIRSLIEEGRCEEAAELLGRPYSIKLEVVGGSRIGRGLGFPTVNQRIPLCQAVPSFGVYCTKCVIDGKEYISVTNVGTRPTVHPDEGDVLCETHILDFEGDLYGETVEVRFYKKLRDEMKYPDIEALKKSVEQDICSTREYFDKLSD